MYLIPKNVKTRFEFFPGFGWKELLITLIGLVVGGILSLIVGFFTEHWVKFLLIIVGGASGYLITSEVPRTGQSVLELVNHFREYKSKNHRYIYVYGEGRGNAKKTSK